MFEEEGIQKERNGSLYPLIKADHFPGPHGELWTVWLGQGEEMHLIRLRIPALPAPPLHLWLCCTSRGVSFKRSPVATSRMESSC